MTMTPKDEAVKSNQEFLELIRRVYGDSNGFSARSLEFKSEMTRDFDLFKNALDLIGWYNDFQPDRVAEALGRVWKKISYVQIGRERSPAIYIGIPFWTNQQIGFLNGNEEETSYRFSNEQRQAIINDVKLVLGGLQADEISEEGTYGSTIRVWWD